MSGACVYGGCVDTPHSPSESRDELYCRSRDCFRRQDFVDVAVSERRTPNGHRINREIRRCERAFELVAQRVRPAAAV